MEFVEFPPTAFLGHKLYESNWGEFAGFPPHRADGEYTTVDSLYLLIPIALLFCVIAIKLLLWAINSGQYEDLDKEAWRILLDDNEEGEDKVKSKDVNND